MKVSKQYLYGALLVGAAVGLTACGGGGGGDSGSVTLTGTAATGARLTNVEVINNQGTMVKTTTKEDGSYSVTIAKAAPYLLRGYRTADNGTITYLYSYYTGGSDSATVNITPFTDVATTVAAGEVVQGTIFNDDNKNGVSDVVDAGGAKSGILTGYGNSFVITEMDTAAKEVNATLKSSQLALTSDVFSYSFKVGSDYDLMLDEISVSYSGALWSISYQGNVVTDFTVDVPVVTGNWQVTVSGTYAIAGNSISIPATTIKNVPAPTPDDLNAMEEDVLTQYNSAVSINTAKITLISKSPIVFNMKFSGTDKQSGFSISYDLTYEYSQMSSSSTSTSPASP